MAEGNFRLKQQQFCPNIKPDITAFVREEYLTKFSEIVCFSEFWGGSLFSWDAKKLRLHKSIKMLTPYKLSYVTYSFFIYISFLCTICYLSWSSGTPLNVYQQSLLILWGCCIPMTSMLTIILKYNELCAFVNGGIAFTEWLSRKQIQQPSENIAEQTNISFSGNFLIKKRKADSSVARTLGQCLALSIPSVKFYAVGAFFLAIFSPRRYFFITGKYFFQI